MAHAKAINAALGVAHGISLYCSLMRLTPGFDRFAAVTWLTRVRRVRRLTACKHRGLILRSGEEPASGEEALCGSVLRALDWQL